MAFEIKVDADGALGQLQELQNNIARLDSKMSDAFLEWQRDDMNRKFPTLEGSSHAVSTTIYPRSRLQRRKGKSGGKQTRRRARVAIGNSPSKRPILRPVLLDQLRQRMLDMLKEATQWQ